MRMTWLIGVLTLLAVGCSSAGSADQASTPTLLVGTGASSSEQLATPSISQSTPAGPAKQLNEPSPQAAGELVFEMEAEYRLGERVEIVIRNDSEVDYYYQSYYPACYNVQFFNDSQESRLYPNEDPVNHPRVLSPGRFIVPSGTHCDLITEESLEPGQSVVLFTWDQQMCTKDRWGCIESVPVEPGEYLIQGEFSQVERGIWPGEDRRPEVITTITWSFTIQSPMEPPEKLKTQTHELKVLR